MEIVRDNLSPGSTANPGIRYNQETEAVEIYDPVSDTWVESEDADPRQVNIYPPMTGGSAACDAAARMSAAVQAIVEAVVTAMNGGAGVAALQGLLYGWLAVFGVFFVLLGLIALVVAAIVEIGAITLAAEFLGFDWDELTCHLVAVVGDDGRMDAEGFATLQADITASYTSVQGTVLNGILSLTGFGALNAFGATRTETGDCSGCNAEACWLPVSFSYMYVDAACMGSSGGLAFDENGAINTLGGSFGLGCYVLIRDLANDSGITGDMVRIRGVVLNGTINRADVMTGIETCLPDSVSLTDFMGDGDVVDITARPYMYISWAGSDTRINQICVEAV